jgi:hypothetical protein
MKLKTIPLFVALICSTVFFTGCSHCIIGPKHYWQPDHWEATADGKQKFVPGHDEPTTVIVYPLGEQLFGIRIK